MPFIFHPSSALATFLNKPSSLLCTVFFIEVVGFPWNSKFNGRECCNNNWAMRDIFKYCKRKGLLIELDGEAILVISGNCGFCRASHRNTKTYRQLPTIWLEPLGRLCRIKNHSYTEYGRIPRYGHLGSPSEGDSHTTLARAGEASMGKALIYIIACHPFSTINSKFRNLGNSIPIKELMKGISERGILLDVVQLEKNLGTAGVRSPQVRILWGVVQHIRDHQTCDIDKIGIHVVGMPETTFSFTALASLATAPAKLSFRFDLPSLSFNMNLHVFHDYFE
ncbi:hypothetical protein CQW23_16035 [Capsicum baccatum]|uniref:Uncharacterized protein n=1 Tax=Capsicum baccatum TaxID=33114 RepID=A0A2G2WNQ5_CAPBA|nr:hypothetical protein CQW23_16035 [Capsicum baccatum]